jgi:threonyl-tRNA synthetase
MGTVYRYERSGTLHGLMRVRGFTQDDAHIFCLESQLEDEIVGVLNLTEKILKQFHFTDYHVMLSTRPAQSVGGDEIWQQATNSLTNALHRKGWKYELDEGGGAFYGPKIDLKIQDAIGRQWQCSTIQCDFNLPERFQLEYISSDQSKQRPIMVHRAIFGSLERFFGVLIENTAGDFPLWISPIHLRLLPVTDSVRDYCEEIQRLASAASQRYGGHGLRIEVDSSGHRVNKQIRTAEIEKIPLMAVIGQKEKDHRVLSLRVKGRGDIGCYGVEDVLKGIQELISKNVVSPEEIVFQNQRIIE